MEWIWLVIGKIADAEGTFRLFRYIGLAALARKWRRKRREALLMSGFEFFPDRATLDRMRDYNDLLARAESIDAAYVTGRKLTEHDIPSIRHIKRVILPDPRSESLEGYAISVRNSPELQRHIIRATQECREKHGIEVRWYPDMYHMSFKIGDADRNHGWVHVELTPPFSHPNRRPSFTVSKNRYETTVAEFSYLFEEMWKASRPPDEDYLREQEQKPVVEL